MSERNDIVFRSNASLANSNTIFTSCNRPIANSYSIFCVIPSRTTTNTSRIVTLYY